ncbi:MAG: PEGA domain-containing protein [Planctomycetota bacterium]|nr:PEGA domain-containing protein [Planctomycetota bacterium]
MQTRFLFLVLLLLAPAGCVRRTLQITSEPPGALVWVNHREVGRTPLEIDFTYYGTYDVQLAREGHEPVLTSADASPPAWDTIGLDFVFDVAPFQSHSKVEWHFDLEERDGDLDALVERARELRSRVDPVGTMQSVTVGRGGIPEGKQDGSRHETVDQNPDSR